MRRKHREISWQRFSRLASCAVVTPMAHSSGPLQKRLFALAIVPEPDGYPSRSLCPERFPSPSYAAYLYISESVG